MAKILGIDLGTTRTPAWPSWKMASRVFLENSEGARTTPSIVAFTKSGERLVGQAAKRQAVTNSQNTIFSSSVSWGANTPRFKNELSRVPYKVVEAKNGDAAIAVDLKGEKEDLFARGVSSFILAKLKADAEAKLGNEKSPQASSRSPLTLTTASVTRPRTPGVSPVSKFCAINQRADVGLACYGLETEGEKIAVYDWARQAFDTLRARNRRRRFEVKATNGDHIIGGARWRQTRSWIGYLAEIQD